VQLEGLGQLKNPLTTSGIEPATFWLVDCNVGMAFVAPPLLLGLPLSPPPCPPPQVPTSCCPYCLSSSRSFSVGRVFDLASVSLNSAHHDSLMATPFSLMFAYSPCSPLSNLWSFKDLLPDDPGADSICERWDAARKNLCLVHDKVRRSYNRNRRPPPFQVGARVWLRNFPVSKAGRHISAKLSLRYKGPYTIAEFTTPVSVRLMDTAGGAAVRAHVSQLKRA
jgi:hypothetical protein